MGTALTFVYVVYVTLSGSKAKGRAPSQIATSRRTTVLTAAKSCGKGEKEWRGGGDPEQPSGAKGVAEAIGGGGG